MSDFFPREQSAISVKELSSQIKLLLDGHFEKVRVEGEISGLRPSSGGHYFGSLFSPDKTACIKISIFKWTASRLEKIPSDGETVILTGKISHYERRGDFSLLVDKVEISGEGAILAMLEERKKRLAEEGLFDMARKRSLPRFAETVGFVTSETGAVIHDVMTTILRRNPKINIILFPCAVQGEGAAETIAAQIRCASRLNLVDALIVGRGGGSFDELLPFSEECVVRAVAECKIPVISAVGHEIDNPLCDFAADIRAPTPTAAAELVTPQTLDFTRQIVSNAAESLANAMVARAEHLRRLGLDEKTENMRYRLENLFKEKMRKADSSAEDLRGEISKRIEALKNRVNIAAMQLMAASPQAILERGYAIVRKQGKIVKSAAKIAPKDILEISFSDGKTAARAEG